MEYNYKNDTLLHSVGFNLQRFVSVLNYGIVSKNKAKELGLSFSKNYKISSKWKKGRGKSIRSIRKCE